MENFHVGLCFIQGIFYRQVSRHLIVECNHFYRQSDEDDGHARYNRFAMEVFVVDVFVAFFDDPDVYNNHPHFFLIHHNSLKYILRFITAANDVQFDCYKPPIYTYGKIELRAFLLFDSWEKILITFSLYLFATKMHSCRAKKNNLGTIRCAPNRGFNIWVMMTMLSQSYLLKNAFFQISLGLFSDVHHANMRIFFKILT